MLAAIARAGLCQARSARLLRAGPAARALEGAVARHVSRRHWSLGAVTLTTTSAAGGAAAAGRGARQQAGMSSAAAAAGAGAGAATEAVVVFVTVPSREVGRKLGRALVEEALAACVNVVPGLLSIYSWEGKVNEDPEELLVIKSRAVLVPQLTARVKQIHPYDECEVIALPIVGGSASYLTWVVESTKARPQSVAAAWHPRLPRLAIATPAAVCELDAVSGCTRNAGDAPGTPLRMAYTPDGGSLVLLTRERGIYCWAGATWRRRQLLGPDPKYEGKKLGAGLMAVSGGQQPIVYWTPLGKTTVRMVHTSVPRVAAGGKLEREFVPGVKLKSDNKKPIVGLAAHPYDCHSILVLLSDARLLLCNVTGAAMVAVDSMPVAMSATKERVGVHAWAHPCLPGAVLVVVEAQSSGLTVIELLPRQESRLLSLLRPPPGASYCGVSLLERGSLLVAAARHASGNVQLLAWQLLGDSREVALAPAVVSPSTAWDALQASVGKATLADASGNNLVSRALFHPATGLVALATAARGSEGSEASHARLPLLQLLDEGFEAAPVPPGVPMHTGLGFWTARDADGVVSKLRFPRYVHVVSAGRLAQYDLTHGLLSDCMVLPPANAGGQERRLAGVVRSAKQGAWLAFMKASAGRWTFRVLSRPAEGAPLAPGQLEWTLVRDADAALTADAWFAPGASGAFVGGRHELVAVLSNAGRTVAVYETAKLQAGPKPLYVAEVKEGRVLSLHPGPPAHIPPLPTPPPARKPRRATAADGATGYGGDDDEAQAAWEAQEARRLELPKQLLFRTEDNKLCLAEVSPSAVTYSGQSRVLATKHAVQLRPGEALVQVAWQTLNEAGSGFHSGSAGAASACAAVAAVLTSERLLLLSERLAVVAAAALAPELGPPVSCLWLGPALLVSTGAGQVAQVCWDGKAQHLCSLLSGGGGAAAAGLLGALADRLLVATAAAAGPGGARAEVCGRAVGVLQPMLLGWASLAGRRILPGGAERVRQELRALVGSYDASQLSAAALERLAGAGFPDVAAAVAARADSPAITLAHRAVFRAAAGDWGGLVALALGDWESSAYHPKPPPRGSPLFARMVAVARACEQYGRFADARALLQAAGAWNELLALCVFQGDFMGLQHYGRSAGGDVERLADQLMAVNEDAFRRVGGLAGSKALYGGRPNTDDWSVSAAVPAANAAALSADEASGGEEEDGEGGEGSADSGGSDAGAAAAEVEEEDVEVAPAGRLPFMEACLQVTSTETQQPAAAGGSEEEGQPIPSLDLGTLEAYVGVPGASVVKPAVGTPSAAAAAAAGGGLVRLETGLSDLSAAQDAAAAAKAASGWDSDAEGSAHGADAAAAAGAARSTAAAAPKEGETAAQAAARAAFRRDTQDEDDFFSSDEESGPTDVDNRSLGSYSTATSTQQRFRISIKAPGEDGRGAGAGPGPAAGADSAALRTAAMGLRLGGPLGRSTSFGAGSLDSTPQGSARQPSPRGSLGQLASGEGPRRQGASSGSLQKDASSDDPFALMVQVGSTSRLGASTSASVSASAEDPFALLASTPPPAAHASGAPKPPAAGGPMRAPAPAPQPASDLMAGWAEFEALFSAPAAPPASSSVAAPLAPAPLPPPPTAKPAALAPAHGAELFRAGSWAAAAGALAASLAAPGAAQLYAAAQLLAAAVAERRAERRARLARFAAALNLAEAERAAAVSFAVDANLEAGNFGYAADQLSWLIVYATGAGAASALRPADLQDKLNWADRADGRNASLPRDEDLEGVRAIVGACTDRASLDDLVAGLAAA
eukprot:scaffold9.g3020.t1